MSDRTLDQWVNLHRQIALQEQNSAIAIAQTSANQGGVVQAKLQTPLPNKPNPMPAIAWNECSEGQQIFLFRPDGEDKWYAIGAGAAQTAETRVVQNIRRRPEPVKVATGPVKVLFSVVRDGMQEFYVGGDRSTPKQVFSLPESVIVSEAYISNTGRNLNSWIASIRTSANVYYTVTPGDVQAIENVPAGVRLDYRGNGFWSTFVQGDYSVDYFDTDISATSEDDQGNTYQYRRRDRLYADGTLIIFEDSYSPPVPQGTTLINGTQLATFNMVLKPFLPSVSGSFNYSGSQENSVGETRNEFLNIQSKLVSYWIDGGGDLQSTEGSFNKNLSLEYFVYPPASNSSTDGTIFDYKYSGSLSANGNTVINKNLLKPFNRSNSALIEYHLTDAEAFEAAYSGGSNPLNLQYSLNLIGLNNFPAINQYTLHESKISGKNSTIFYKTSITTGVNNPDQGYHFIDSEGIEFQFNSVSSVNSFGLESSNLLGSKILVAPIINDYKNQKIRADIEVYPISIAGTASIPNEPTKKSAEIFSLRSPDCTIHSASAFL